MFCPKCGTDIPPGAQFCQQLRRSCSTAGSTAEWAAGYGHACGFWPFRSSTRILAECVSSIR